MKHFKPHIHHQDFVPRPPGGMNLDPLYDIARAGEHVTRESGSDLNVIFKAITAVGLGWFACKQATGAYNQLLRRIEDSERQR